MKNSRKNEETARKNILKKSEEVSGLKDVIRYLVEHEKVDVCVTSGGGVEEDIIKCLGDFILGDFRAKGEELREKTINRIGNIFVPNSRYIKFEEFAMPVLEEL